MEMTVKVLFDKINNAFFRLESYAKNGINEYHYFGFESAFIELFKDVRKPENYTFENCKIIDFYYTLTVQLTKFYDKGEFDNENVYDNEMFCKDLEELIKLQWDYVEEFCAICKIIPDTEEENVSIVDIINTKNKRNKLISKTTFKSLFFNDYATDEKINELKNILETNIYTVKGQWRGITGKGNELAYLYHYLKSNPGVITTADFKTQIKVFYNEFGLTVKDKLEPGVFCVTKTLQKYSNNSDTYKDFERLFIHWVK